MDRCDRCGAQAYLRVELAGGGELLFCAHHAREHGDKLREIAVTVHDETGKLRRRPAASGRETLSRTHPDVASPGRGPGLAASPGVCRERSRSHLL